MPEKVGTRKIINELRTDYGLDGYYYPKISMETDLPRGFEGEVNSITRQLANNGFNVSSENVLSVMRAKKKLLQRYYGKSGIQVNKNYEKLILEEVKPVGTPGSIEFLLVCGLISVILYMAGKFLGSFSEETGKIAARRLLKEDKETAKELNIDIKEYQFIANEVNILIKENELSDLLEIVTKTKKKKRLSRRRNKEKK
jgi:hypothetical protein